jgi:predicted transcriptional regulator
VGNVTAAREKWARVREWRRKFEIDQVRAFFTV